MDSILFAVEHDCLKLFKIYQKDTQLTNEILFALAKQVKADKILAFLAETIVPDVEMLKESLGTPIYSVWIKKVNLTKSELCELICHAAVDDHPSIVEELLKTTNDFSVGDLAQMFNSIPGGRRKFLNGAVQLQRRHAARYALDRIVKTDAEVPFFDRELALSIVKDDEEKNALLNWIEKTSLNK